MAERTLRLLVVGCLATMSPGCGRPAAPPSPTPATQSPSVRPSTWGEEQQPALVDDPLALRLPEKIAAQHLPNAWRVHPKVISGGLPEGEAAFKELSDMGVKTVISVDGVQPDVSLAKKYGLRYVHMPHGYDGVPEPRSKELAKAVRDLPGSIYIHCHHGKHRSLAAAAVACVGAGLIPADRALAVLRAAGTSQNYRGLFDSAESATPLDQAMLDELSVEYLCQVNIYVKFALNLSWTPTRRGRLDKLLERLSLHQVLRAARGVGDGRRRGVDA